MMKEWCWEYLIRIGVFVGGVGAIGLFTGQWSAIEEFFRDNPLIGTLALGVDLLLYVVRKLDEREETDLMNRLRTTARTIRMGGDRDE